MFCFNAFLSNLQTRIYSELSKQVTEQLFAEAGADAGQFTLDGNTVTWGKIGDTITLSVYSTEGEVTTITIPIGTLSLPDTGLGEDADKLWDKTKSVLRKYETKTGVYRPDLSYIVEK